MVITADSRIYVLKREKHKLDQYKLNVYIVNNQQKNNGLWFGLDSTKLIHALSLRFFSTRIGFKIFFVATFVALSVTPLNNWVRVFKNRPRKVCRRQPLKNLKWYDLPKQTRPYHFKFFKGCLPKILLGPFLNTLTQLSLE